MSLTAQLDLGLLRLLLPRNEKKRWLINDVRPWMKRNLEYGYLDRNQILHRLQPVREEHERYFDETRESITFSLPGLKIGY